MTTTTMTVAAYLTQQVQQCGKTQREIAAAAGFDNPNIITLLKQGKTKLPFARVVPLAQALGIEPQHLFALVMADYYPDTWDAIKDRLDTPATADEIEIVEAIREVGGNLQLRTTAERDALLAVLATCCAP